MNNIQAKIRLASQMLNKRKIDTAIVMYKEVLKEDPKNIGVFIQLGQIYVDKEMWEEALYYFLRAEVVKPIPEVYLNIGVLFYKKKNYKKANEYYEKTERMGRPLFELYWNKGLAYEKMKMKKEATFEYIKAYELNPKFELCYKIAPIALQASLYLEAIHFYKIILERDENAFYYAEMGLAYMVLCKYDESKTCYQKAKDLTKLAGKYPEIDEITFDDFIAKYPNIEEKIGEMKEKIEKGLANYCDRIDFGNMLFIKGEYQRSEQEYIKAREEYIYQLIMKL